MSWETRGHNVGRQGAQTRGWGRGRADRGPAVEMNPQGPELGGPSRQGAWWTKAESWPPLGFPVA